MGYKEIVICAYRRRSGVLAEAVGDQRRKRFHDAPRRVRRRKPGSRHPGLAASIISPMIDVPPTATPSFSTVTSASKLLASWTNLATRAHAGRAG
jgi:hypothetical protein